MDFDLSKENIQPLRGGRNVTQLAVALQAQNDSESQCELLEQKRAYEETIRTYDGDDPLDNWYNYIYWVEQSYPKHGHEGNLIPILEDCLSKFENDERYIHDRRLCKLWIKYIDLQQNPLELFQLLYSKGICVNCADLYRAWAFYHEVAGDYKRADTVFQLGLKNFAQPFEELSAAHQNMFTAIGRETIQGVDEKRREEMRQGLTSLVSYKHNQRTMVPSVRIGSNVHSSTPGSLACSSKQDRSNNVPITVYEDLAVAGPSIGACASVSVLEVARKPDTVHKENTLKPGNWKKSIITKKVPQHLQPSFTVHEDEDPLMSGGPRLPKDFAPMNFDDFSNWKTDIFFPEPQDDTKIPMYPKHIVYGTPGVEYSPEEIRASKWFTKQKDIKKVTNESSVAMQETMMEDANIMVRNSSYQVVSEVEQAIQSILPPGENTNNLPHNIFIYEEERDVPKQFVSNIQESSNFYYQDQIPSTSANITTLPSPIQYQFKDHSTTSEYTASKYNVPSDEPAQQWARESYSREVNQNSETASAVAQIQHWPNNTLISNDSCTQNMREAMKDINEIWKDSPTNIHEPSIRIQKPEISNFQIYEDTKLQDDVISNKMESRPVKNKIDSNLQFSIFEDDIGNNKKRISQQNFSSREPAMGCRKSLRDSIRTQFSSQPPPEVDCELPRKTPSYSEPFDDRFKFPADVIKSQTPKLSPNLNDTCTEKFNFNLRHVSTPLNFKTCPVEQFVEPPTLSSKKALFDKIEEMKFVQQEETQQKDKLSVILETTKEYGSSSSGSSSSTTAFKTTTYQRESLKAIPETSRTYDESLINEAHGKVQDQVIANKSIEQKTENAEMNYYNLAKMIFKDDSVPDNRKSFCPSKTTFSSISKQNIVDLTEEDSIYVNQNLHSFGEIGAGDNLQNQQQIKKPLMDNYESPMKNQFKEMTCDSSNDSLSNSPVKGQKMDVDVFSSQNSNSAFKMEHESLETFHQTILQKLPSDPFQHNYLNALLKKVGFPNPKYSGQYIEMQHLPKLVGKKEVVTFVNNKYLVEKVIGKGAFGFVYKATNINSGEIMALKFQKPSNKWEYYIIKEIRQRLNNPYMLPAYMDVTACYVSPSASILVSEFFKFGSLLDLTNKMKKTTGKGLKEIVAIYYANEIITIINTLHQCQIIHADIKPDNFLVIRMPPEFGHPSLQLIDFGSCIDMSLFPKGTTFSSVVKTENFICTEMKDGRPWTYQTDIFCIAATVHVLLFDKYMQLQKNGSVWTISQHIPRYLQVDFWKTFFFQMLNIESCDKLPDLAQLKGSFEGILAMNSEELQMELRAVANIILGR